MFQISIFYLSYSVAERVIGYDCNISQTEKINITTWSLLKPKPCSMQKPSVEKKIMPIQLLESKHFDDITVIQCKINIRRTLRRCSFWNYLEPVDNGLQEYLLEVSHEVCARMHTSRIFNYDNTHVIYDLKINDSTSRGMYLAGDAIDGSCNTGSFSDRYGTWSNVNVEALITITLMEYVARVDIIKNKLMLRSGVVCNFNDLTCIDSEGGYTFWKPFKQTSCLEEKYNVIYDGLATEIKTKRSNELETLYVVNNNIHLFSILVIGEINDCGIIFMRTEHNLIFVRMSNNVNYKNPHVKYPDLFTYFNSKSLAIERSLNQKIEDVYYNMLEKRCELLEKELKQQLSLAHLSPDLFAYNLLNSPGYIAHRSGEAVHIIKCIAVEVKVAGDLNECYDQLPVYWKDELWFLTPVTRIVVRKALQITCNDILPTLYKINQGWIKFNPKAVAVSDPSSLEADAENTLTFDSMNNAAEAGLYSAEDMNNFMNKLMFPIEKQAILNDVARSINMEPIRDGKGLQNLISENVLESVLMKKWHLIWSSALTFGQFSSGVVVIMMLAGVLKLGIEAIIRGYALHHVFGISIKLLGALFGSLTHLLVTKEHEQRVKTNEEVLKKILKQNIRVESNSIKNDKQAVFYNPKSCEVNIESRKTGNNEHFEVQPVRKLITVGNPSF